MRGRMVVVRLSRRRLRWSVRCPEQFLQRVPAMGDSIVEGTLSSWEKQVGDSVNADDVVATIDTDKVSVEVRAERSGALVELLAAVDDTVTVGSDFFKLDTDAAPAAKATTTPATPVAAPVEEEAPPPKRAHVPLIKFLGKRHHVKRDTTPLPPPAPLTDVVLAGAAFRLAVTDSEISAVESGGASLLD